MTSRRTFLKQLSAAAAAQALFGCASPGTPRTKASSASADSVGASAAEHAAYFERRGFTQVPASALLTRGEFNGGLCYDDPFEEATLGTRVRVQVCGRIEDLDRHDEPATLARFHMLGIALEDPHGSARLVDEVLVYATRFAGLDASRIVVVSSEWVEPYRGVLAHRGIGAERIVVRPTAEVLAARDGSGYFAPPGHPGVYLGPSLSLHYPVSASVSTRGLAHPLEGYVEIAEILLSEPTSVAGRCETASIGLERVLFARGETIPDFESSRLALVREIELEAARRGIALPPAHAALARAASNPST